MPMPATAVAITARGFHYYYHWPPGATIRTCQIAPKLEIRGAGAYVIAPPSVHPTRSHLPMGAAVAGPGSAAPCLACRPSG